MALDDQVWSVFFGGDAQPPIEDALVPDECYSFESIDPSFFDNIQLNELGDGLELQETSQLLSLPLPFPQLPQLPQFEDDDDVGDPDYTEDDQSSQCIVYDVDDDQHVLSSASAPIPTPSDHGSSDRKESHEQYDRECQRI